MLSYVCGNPEDNVVEVFTCRQVLGFWDLNSDTLACIAFAHRAILLALYS